MAIIYSYPTAVPELQDLLVGTEMAEQGGEGTPRTRTFTIGSVIELLTPALDLKANIASPTFTGVVTSPSFVKTGGSSTQYLMADGSTFTGGGAYAFPTLQQVTTTGPITTNNIEANSFVKTGGSPTQYLMANGTTSTMPTLQQVITAGDTVTDVPIILNSDGTDAPLQIFCEGNNGIFINAGNGTGISASTGNGNGATINASGTGNALVIDGLNKGIVVVNGGISIAGNPNSATTYQLSLSSNLAAKPSTNTWTIASDSRVKTNINPYTKGLETILAINPITYDYNGKAGFDPTTIGNIGIIAQDVLNIIPESINTYQAKLNEEDEEKTELYNFDSHALTFILINAIKQLSAEIELLKSI